MRWHSGTGVPTSFGLSIARKDFSGVCCARGAEERTQNPKKSDDARNKYALPVCVGVGGAMSVGCEVRMSKRQPDGSTHAGRRRLLFC